MLNVIVSFQAFLKQYAACLIFFHPSAISHQQKNILKIFIAVAEQMFLFNVIHINVKQKIIDHETYFAQFSENGGADDECFTFLFSLRQRQ